MVNRIIKELQKICEQNKILLSIYSVANKQTNPYLLLTISEVEINNLFTKCYFSLEIKNLLNKSYKQNESVLNQFLTLFISVNNSNKIQSKNFFYKNTSFNGIYYELSRL